MSRAWSDPDVAAVEQNQSVYGNETVTLRTNGVYHVKFVWVPTPANEPAPKNMIVSALSYAGWHGPTSRTTGQALNGLNTQQSVASDGSSGDALGLKYYLKDGSSGIIQFDIPIDSSLTAMGRSVPPFMQFGSIDSVSVSRYVTPSIYTLTLNVYGVTPAYGTNNILIGQQCWAAWTTNAPNITFTNYQWSLANPAVFASFDMASDKSWGHKTECDFRIWTSPTPYWYWYDRGDGTVTGTVTVMAGGANGENLGTASDSKPGTVWRPYSKMRGIPSSVNYTAGQGSVIAQGPNGTSGIEFIGSVGTPDLFLSSGTGQWCFAQLIWLDRVQHTFGNPIGFATTTNGALDGSYSMYGNYWLADSQADLHTEHSEDDNPEEEFRPNIQSYRIADTYKMYMMYQSPPKSTGIQWVPIHSLLWHWNVGGSRIPTQPFSPSPPDGSVSANDAVEEHEHPHWTEKYDPGH